MPQVDAPQLALAQHNTQVQPAERLLLFFDVLLDVHQPATLLDQLDFLLIDALEITWLAIHRVPDQRPQHADSTGSDKHHVPAVVRLQPGQHRGQKRQTNELSGGVDADGGSPLALGKPGGDHAAVDRISRRFQRTNRHAQYEQGDEAGGEAEHDGRDGPQQQGCGVENARRHAVHQPAPGQLHGGVGPAERGKDQPDMHRVKAQFGGQRWCGDRQVAAVQVVDHYGDEQQHHDKETLAGRRHQGCRTLQSSSAHGM